MSKPLSNTPVGRGSPLAPPSRFDTVQREVDFDQLEPGDELLDDSRKVATVFLPDHAQSIVSENDSPDIPFRYSLNPYRGCEHGCSYCYARPYHEYLGLNAGIDFETKIFVKERAPELFRDWLAKFKGEPSAVSLSGVTDCYQPAERRFRLTRGCVEVALAARYPLRIITKNALILRDLDVLRELATLRLVNVAISITTLDPELARTMEPRTSHPEARLRAIRELSAAGVPTLAMVAPIIPGLNDSDLPSVLKAAASAGAYGASYTVLRLPLSVKPVFLDWLERTQPTKRDKIEAHIRSTRDGELTSSQFGQRMRGSGVLAEQIQRTFQVFAKKYGLNRCLPALDGSQFVPPPDKHGQLKLF